MPGIRKYELIEKFCSNCKQTLPIDQFTQIGVTSLGFAKYAARCKPCSQKAYKALPTAQKRAYDKRSRDANREYRQGRRRYLYQNQTPEERFAKRVERYYNISYTQWLELFDKQHGQCAICQMTLTDPRSGGFSRNDPYRFHTDHDHNCCPSKTSCGKCMRGILCNDCNAGIGFLKDNIKILKNAITYLEG